MNQSGPHVRRDAESLLAQGAGRVSVSSIMAASRPAPAIPVKVRPLHRPVSNTSLRPEVTSSTTAAGSAGTTTAAWAASARLASYG